MDAEGGSRTLPLPLVSLSRATPGDFVAMMQGGAVDHQRAVDAVAQVVDHILLHRISLTIDSSRSAVRAHRQHSGYQACHSIRTAVINTMTPNDVFENADWPAASFSIFDMRVSSIGSDRHPYALSLIKVMHTVCHSGFFNT